MENDYNPSNRRFNGQGEVKTIANEYHVITTDRSGNSIDWNKPVGLLIRLHGDGAGEYTRGQASTTTWEYADEAIANNMMVIIPRTPDVASNTWWQATERAEHRAYLESLVDSVIAEPNYPNINRSDIFWYGYSGGAEFLGYDFITNATNYITSGAILTGGGGKPSWYSY